MCRWGQSSTLSRVDAENTLARLPNAAIAIATEKRMEQFVDVANRIHTHQIGGKAPSQSTDLPSLSLIVRSAS